MKVTRSVELDIPLFDCIFCGQSEVVDGIQKLSCVPLVPAIPIHSRIHCENCCAYGPSGKTKEEAIVKWNTRIGTGTQEENVEDWVPAEPVDVNKDFENYVNKLLRTPKNLLEQ